MPKLGPIGRKDLIQNLKRLGFEGAFPGGKHEYLVKCLIQPNQAFVFIQNTYAAHARKS
jgi:hypothetical protein